MLRFFNNPVPESALAYCRSLALQIQRSFGHALTPEVWTSIMGTQVPDPTRVAYGLLAEKYLAPNVAAQARLAALLEYPPSKWLLEREMEARGNWPGPNTRRTLRPSTSMRRHWGLTSRVSASPAEEFAARPSISGYCRPSPPQENSETSTISRPCRAADTFICSSPRGSTVRDWRMWRRNCTRSRRLSRAQHGPNLFAGSADTPTT